MQKGRKIQREWSKVPGGTKKVPEVFSEGQPQGEVFESKDQLRKTNIRDQIEYTHPKWASSKHPGFLVAVVS